MWVKITLQRAICITKGFVDKHRIQLTRARAGRLLQWLEPLQQQDAVSLPAFDLAELAAPVHTIEGIEFADGQVQPESYWGRWCMNFALRARFTWPTDGQSELYLPLGKTGDIFSHPECLVYLNGQCLGSADRHHHRIEASAEPGQACELILTGWTGLSGWPHDPNCKTQLFMRTCQAVRPNPDMRSVIGLMQVLLEASEQVEDPTEILDALSAGMSALDTRYPMDDGRLQSSIGAARAAMTDRLQSSPLNAYLHGIGHAHMDLAYLWTTEQTRAKAGRTFSNVLRLMDQFPGYQFTQSQPQLYQWLQQDYPQLFEGVKRQVEAGRWELTGGMWVEPDCNIPSGESLVRQILWGRNYFAEQFEAPETPVLFLPDTFGFNAQLPQLMRLSGLKYFMTNKTNWNQLNPLPHQTFRWSGLDGSEVLGQTFTTPRQVQYLPHPTTYKAELTGAEVMGTWSAYQQQDALRELPIAYGYGDGGGGPNQPMLERAELWHQMPGMPSFGYSTLRQFFQAVEQADQRADLPQIQGELYLELHRGTYTSQGLIKQANAEIERQLHRVEFLAACLMLRGERYPQDQINDVWRALLLNQFHDILPGTAISDVFIEAHQSYSQALNKLTQVEADIVQRLLGEQGYSAFNDQCVSQQWAVIPHGWSIQGADGPTPGQRLSHGTLVPVELAPYSGQVLTLGETPLAQGGIELIERADGLYVANGHTEFVITPEGWIKDWLDAQGEPVLRDGAAANQWWAFEDRPVCWDAWDIDPYFEDHATLLDGQGTLRILEQGPLQLSVEVTTHWQSSQIVQVITLRSDSGLIDVAAKVNWQESETLLKVSLPSAIESDQARYEIQFGSLERPAHRRDEYAAARFEVPAQRWATVHENDRGVAIVNDCKYGYDCNQGHLRLSLIKSSTSPAADADRGEHSFRFGLMAYRGHWSQLNAVSRRFASPVQVLPGQWQPVDLPWSDLPDNLMLDTIKPAEDGRGIIGRAYESAGRTISKFEFKGQPVDLLEQPIDGSEALGAFQIVSRRFEV